MTSYVGIPATRVLSKAPHVYTCPAPAHRGVGYSHLRVGVEASTKTLLPLEKLQGKFFNINMLIAAGARICVIARAYRRGCTVPFGLIEFDIP